MPTKQTSRKKSAPKRPRTNGRKSGSSRSIYIGIALVGLLILLIVVGSMSLFSSKPAQNASAPKTEVTIPVPVTNKQKTETGKLEVKKASQTPEDKGKAGEDADSYPGTSSDNSDIASLVRLVLYDFEIARSAVEERTTKTPKGKIIYHFNVKAHSDTVAKLRDALMSVFKQKGYRTGMSKKGSIGAESKNDEVNIVFDETLQTGKDPNTVKTKNNPEKQTLTSSIDKHPTPPTPADVVVKLAILLDDGGSNINLVKRFVKLPFPVGIAVLPHLKYSEESARLASAYGKTVFLHFPMEPKSYPSSDPGEGAALVSMPELLIDGVVKKNFESLGVKVDGFNNHMGSAITEDKVKMNQIMAIASKYTDVFVDSRTTANSVAYDECAKAGMKCAINKRFIDNDNDVDAIIAKIYEGAELAKKNGEALVIGHIRQHTLDALEIALPILQERRITIVPVTSMTR